MADPNKAEKNRAAAAAAMMARTEVKLQDLDAENAQSALPEVVKVPSPAFPPVQQNVAVQEYAAGLSGSAIQESDRFSRADSAIGLQAEGTSANNESGGNTSSMQLSALFKSFKGSTSSNASSAEVDSPLTVVEPINKETESQKLTESLKQPKNASTASVSNESSAPKERSDVLLFKTTQKKEQEDSIRAFVEQNPYTVKLVTENTSITRKHSSENAPVPSTPRAVSKEITPADVATARSTLDKTLVVLEGNLKLTLANTDMSITELKDVLKLEITPDNLEQLQLPEIIKSGELLKSFGNILRQKKED